MSRIGLAVCLLVMIPSIAFAQWSKPTGVGLGTGVGGGFVAGAGSVLGEVFPVTQPKFLLPNLSIRVHHASRYRFEVDFLIPEYILTSALGSPTIAFPTRHFDERRLGSKGRFLGGVAYTQGIMLIPLGNVLSVVNLQAVGPAIGLEGAVGPLQRTQMGLLVQTDFIMEYSTSVAYFAAGFKLSVMFRVTGRVDRNLERPQDEAIPGEGSSHIRAEGEADPPPENELERHDQEDIDWAYRKAERLLDKAAEKGIDTRSPIWITHLAAFEAQGDAQAFAALLEDEGYHVSIDQRAGQDRPWVVMAMHRFHFGLRPLARLRLYIERLAHRLRGDYEGWRVIWP